MGDPVIDSIVKHMRNLSHDETEAYLKKLESEARPVSNLVYSETNNRDWLGFDDRIKRADLGLRVSKERSHISKMSELETQVREQQAAIQAERRASHPKREIDPEQLQEIGFQIERLQAKRVRRPEDARRLEELLDKHAQLLRGA